VGGIGCERDRNWKMYEAIRIPSESLKSDVRIQSWVKRKFGYTFLMACMFFQEINPRSVAKCTLAVLYGKKDS
jgi:hypothetical protein